MEKKAALQIITKGCLHVEWNMAGKIFTLLKVGQISFQILSCDLVKQSFGWTAGTINPGTRWRGVCLNGVEWHNFSRCPKAMGGGCRLGHGEIRGFTIVRILVRWG